MAQRQPSRRQVTLERERPRASPHRHRERLAVEVHDVAHTPHVQRDHARVRSAQRRHPSHDAGAAAEGDDRQRLARTVLEQRPHLLVAFGQHHGVGRRLGRAAAQTHEIGIAAPGRVGDAFGVVCAHVAVAHDAHQPLERGGAERAGGQAHGVQRDGRAGTPEPAQGGCEMAHGPRRKLAGMTGITPAPPAHTACAAASH